MRDYDVGETQDIYSRLQSGKPLKIGERVKALKTDFKPYFKELATHKLFTVAGGRHLNRDAHWNLAAQFYKAAWNGDPLDRVEFTDLEHFFKATKFNEKEAENAKAKASKIMNFEYKIIQEAIQGKPDAESIFGTARPLKWLYAGLFELVGNYSLTGTEHLAAQGFLDYWAAKASEGSPEWNYYVQTGRTGRMDTDDVKKCLNQLSVHIINATQAEPLDKKRFFSHTQREKIWENSKGKCAVCGIPLSKTNFHADHKKPHRANGPTSVENGQALCTKCNYEKGGFDLTFPVGK